MMMMVMISETHWLGQAEILDFEKDLYLGRDN